MATLTENARDARAALTVAADHLATIASRFATDVDTMRTVGATLQKGGLSSEQRAGIRAQLGGLWVKGGELTARLDLVTQARETDLVGDSVATLAADAARVVLAITASVQAARQSLNQSKGREPSEQLEALEGVASSLEGAALRATQLIDPRSPAERQGPYRSDNRDISGALGATQLAGSLIDTMRIQVRDTTPQRGPIPRGAGRGAATNDQGIG